MTRFSSSIWCATFVMSAALLSCSSSDGGGGGGGGGGSGGTAGSGGSGSGGTGGGGGGGGTQTSDPLEIIPRDNDTDLSPGWIVDTNVSKPGVRAMTGASLKEVESLIDGGATPFFSVYTPKLFMWQNYINTELKGAPEDGATMMLYVMQMSSAADAAGLYTSVLKTSDYTRKVGTPDDWKDVPGLGDAARIQDSGTSWWVNFHKGAYYVEAMLAPSFGPPPDYTISDPDLKQGVLDFAKAIAARIH